MGQPVRRCSLQAREKLDTNLEGSLILDFSPPKMSENKFLLFKAPSPVVFVMTAVADS